jgi:hypothetical protein
MSLSSRDGSGAMVLGYSIFAVARVRSDLLAKQKIRISAPFSMEENWGTLAA